MIFSILLFFLHCIAFSSRAIADDGSADASGFHRTSHVYPHLPSPIPYTAVTGTFPVSNGQGKCLADLFFLAYLVENEPNRPITFVFPGGPGASCEAEVLCSIGPRRMQTPKEGKPLLPPYPLIDNPESLLPWTDLVFVDPVETGYSRFAEAIEEEEARQFFTTDGDIAALGDFVQRFVSYFERWNSPKYLSGTSYGTVRCCGLAEYLALYDFSLHGLILLGSCMDFSTLMGQHNLPLPDSLLIPTFAATAWYHGRLWPEASLKEVVDYARRFSYERHLPFLYQPTRLGPYEQKNFFSDLAFLIGLSPDIVRRYCGRFDERLYTTEFMAFDRKVIGGLDTRYVGEISSIERGGEDPSYHDMQGLSCAFNQYLCRELETPPPLEPYISFSTPQHWNFSTRDSIAWPDVLQRVRRTLIRNPAMRIFSGSGYYDCRTPFAATEYCFDHLDLAPSYKKNIQFEYYEAGHGFIFDYPSLQKLKEDLVRFYTQTTSKFGS